MKLTSSNNRFYDYAILMSICLLGVTGLLSFRDIIVETGNLLVVYLFEVFRTFLYVGCVLAAKINRKFSKFFFLLLLLPIVIEPLSRVLFMMRIGLANSVWSEGALMSYLLSAITCGLICIVTISLFYLVHSLSRFKYIWRYCLFSAICLVSLTALMIALWIEQAIQGKDTAWLLVYVVAIALGGARNNIHAQHGEP